MKNGQRQSFQYNLGEGKPFLKWVGGKSQLSNEIFSTFSEELLCAKNLTYVEPFVGGGAVLFRMLRERPNITKAVINDINPALIASYLCVRDNPQALIAELSELERCFLNLSPEGDSRREFFLERRKEFNELLGIQRAGGSFSKERLSALLIFLNRTCFNGLFRVNSRGDFNVPFGKYKNPKICDTETLLADSKLLQQTEILCGDFSETLQYANENSIFYLDPPYKPISATSNFNSYAQGGFDDSEQIRLRDFCRALKTCGAKWVLSNSDARDESGESFFDDLYVDFRIRRVWASRMVNADASKRGKLSEVLISAL